MTSTQDAINKGYIICASMQSYVGTEVQQRFPTAKFVDVNGEDILTRMLAGDCQAALVDHDLWRISESLTSLNPGCRFEYVGRPVVQLSAGFAIKPCVTKCTSLVRDVLDIYMQEMVIDGTIDALWEKLTRQRAQQSCPAAAAQKMHTRLQPESMAGLFMLVIFASLVAVPLAHCEMAQKSAAGLAPRIKKSICSWQDDREVIQEDGSDLAEEHGSASVEVDPVLAILAELEDKHAAMVQRQAELQELQAQDSACFDEAMEIIRALVVRPQVHSSQELPLETGETALTAGGHGAMLSSVGGRRSDVLLVGHEMRKLRASSRIVRGSATASSQVNGAAEPTVRNALRD